MLRKILVFIAVLFSSHASAELSFGDVLETVLQETIKNTVNKPGNQDQKSSENPADSNQTNKTNYTHPNSIVCSLTLKSGNLIGPTGPKVPTNFGWKDGIFYAEHYASAQTRAKPKPVYRFEQNGKTIQKLGGENLSFETTMLNDGMVDYFSDSLLGGGWDDPKKQANWFASLGFDPEKDFLVVQESKGKTEKHTCAVKNEKPVSDNPYEFKTDNSLSKILKINSFNIVDIQSYLSTGEINAIALKSCKRVSVNKRKSRLADGTVVKDFSLFIPEYIEKGDKITIKFTYQDSPLPGSVFSAGDAICEGGANK